MTLLSFFVTPNAVAVPAGVFGFASIVPGLGQALNGNIFEGLAWLTSTIGLSASGNSTAQSMGFDLWQYNMYDAYRDAAGKPSSKENVLQNWVGNFNPLNIIDPIGAPIVGIAALSGKSGAYPALKDPKSILMYSFVGLGEEGLFRGFLYPTLSNTFDNRFAGAVVSSALFALAHVTGGVANLAPMVLGIRFLLGTAFCWQLTINKYDLRQNIFAHSWYDVLVAKEAGHIKTQFTLGWKMAF